MNRIIKAGIKKIDSVVLACLFSISSILFLFSINDSGSWIYLFFVLYFISLMILNKDSFSIKRVNKKMLDVVLITMFMLLMVLISAVWAYNIENIIKLMVSIILAMFTYFMSKENIYWTYVCVVIINTIYAIVVCLKTDRVYNVLSGGDTNYLNMTLPLGLTLTLTLTFFVVNLFFKRRLEPISLIISIILFTALSKFTARGSLLFPILIAFIIASLIGTKNKVRFFVVVIVLGIIIFLAYRYFITYANAYIVNRMTRLFSENNSEDRWGIWKTYIAFISRDNMYIVGGGAGSAIAKLGYYPHNILLQMLGELGFLVTVSFIYICCKMFIGTIKINKRLKGMSLNREIVVFYLSVAGVMYYFLTFMKSFQVYDAYLLYIILAMTLKINNTITIGGEKND